MMSLNTKTKRIVLIAGIAFIVLYLGMAIHYEGHFFPGSTVDGIPVSGKTASEVDEAIKAKVGDYKLTLVEEDRTNEEIAASEVGLEIVLSDTEVKKILSAQSGMAWPAGLFSKSDYKTEHALFLDNAKLDARISSLDCVVNKGMKSVNATYKLDGDKYVIIDEKYGTRVKKKKLSEAVRNSMTALADELNLRDNGIYVDPKIKKTTKKLVNLVKRLNKYMAANITYDLGKEKEVLDKATQASFLRITEDNKVTFDDDKILEYLKTMARKYNTFSIAREFKTSYGMTVTVPSGGDYGWWINYAEEREQLKKDISSGKDVTRDFIYHNKAASHEMPDYGNSYVEVNIATQHLFLIIDGKRVLESDFVSGNVSRGNGTPLGTFCIAYKERDATLNGENYSTPVKWWMPFYYNVGLHDANWRSSFGGQIYKTSGSHGCVNLPPAVAEKIFGYVEAGFPVIVYNEAPPSTSQQEEVQ